MAFPDTRYIPQRGDDWVQRCEIYSYEASHPNTTWRQCVKYLGVCANGMQEPAGRVLSGSRVPLKGQNTLYSHYREQQKAVENGSKGRLTTAHISKVAERVLDAPALIDDFYLHLLDSPRKLANHFAIALSNRAYLFNCETSGIREISKLPDDGSYFSCVRWLANESHILLGDQTGEVAIGDIEKRSTIYRKLLSTSRIHAAEHFGQAGCIVGDKLGNILQIDVRDPSMQRSFPAHSDGGICALTLHRDGHFLASGGNDNLVKLWDLRYQGTVRVFDLHTAAVRALCWAPWRNDLLFSGGGTADKTIKAVTINDGAVIASCRDGNSQVSAIHVSEGERRLVSCHGYSLNKAIIWRFDDRFKELARLEGHTNRILQSTLINDATMLLTAGADETLRFWNVFQKRVPEKKKDESMFSLIR